VNAFLDRLVLPAERRNVRDLPDSDTWQGVLRAWLAAPTPRLLALNLLLLLVARVLLGGPFAADQLWVVLAVALWWPFQEWAAHLVLLHFRPRRIGPFLIDPLAARVHRFHHAEPWSYEPIFVPWPIITVLMPVHAALWWLALPPGQALTGAVCYAGCALFYEWIHLMAHTPWVPQNRWMRRVQAHHRAHHFRNEQHWFAFMVPALDDWCGTGGEPREVPRSATTRTLGIELS